MCNEWCNSYVLIHGVCTILKNNIQDTIMQCKIWNYIWRLLVITNYVQLLNCSSTIELNQRGVKKNLFAIIINFIKYI